MRPGTPHITPTMAKSTGTTGDGGTVSSVSENADARAHRGADTAARSDIDVDVDTTFDTVATVEERSLPLDQTFEILRNQRRRYVLQYLDATEGQVSLSDLAEQIAAWENDKEVREISSSERKRVYVGLYQCHLPKMDDMGVVAFNKPRGIVEPGENVGAVVEYLRTDDETTTDASRTRYYLGLSLLGVFLLPALALAGAGLTVSLLAAVAIVLGVALGAGLHLARRGTADDR